MESSVANYPRVLVSKQVLDVMTEEELHEGETPTEPEKDLTKKEEAPQTLVIGADGKQVDEKK